MGSSKNNHLPGVYFGVAFLSVGFWMLVSGFLDYMALAETIAPDDKWAWARVEVPPELKPAASGIWWTTIFASFLIILGCHRLWTNFKSVRKDG